jgi:hypothetical protein
MQQIKKQFVISFGIVVVPFLFSATLSCFRRLGGQLGQPKRAMVWHLYGSIERDTHRGEWHPSVGAQ